MTGWGEFVFALCAFLASHALPVRPPIRGRLVKLFGARGFTVAYSALSLLILAWTIAAAGRAPYVELWPFALWQLWAPNIAMPLAVALISLALFAPNPLSFGGRDARFDPARPGVVGLSRHPLPLALALWSAAHLVPNGTLAHVLLFGLFLVFSILGMAIIDRRKRRQMGVEAWSRLAANTGWLRPAGLGDVVALLLTRAGVLRLAGGALAYVALLHLHMLLFGVEPWPGGAWPS
jgi:uncharacterized membrane protein